MRHWRDQFRRAPLAADAVAALRQRSDEIWQHAFELLKRESPEYRNSVDDEFTKIQGTLQRALTIDRRDRICEVEEVQRRPL